MMSDEENELELLRLAALQTLVKHTTDADIRKQEHHPPVNTTFSHNNQLSWRKYPCRGGPQRNGQFNGRKIRNANLIAIPTVQSCAEDMPQKNNKYENSIHLKLALPQNRYCNKMEDNADTDDLKKECSKFSRYEDSSESDSDASGREGSGNEAKLVRSNSLDALVQELEFEISGQRPEPLKKAKIKKVKSVDNAKNDKEKLNDVNADKNDVQCVPVNKNIDAIKNISSRLEIKEESQIQETNNSIGAMPQQKLHGHTESNTLEPEASSKRTLLPRPNNVGPNSIHTNPRSHRDSKPFKEGQNHMPPRFPHSTKYHPQHQPYVPEGQHSHLSHSHQGYAPVTAQYYPPHHQQLPARPLSPLNLNQNSIGSITMGALSPRSAAFVLQNRQIIEKRKRSPRRSYSRSPSPRLKRSKSPRRRSASPRRCPRSVSPKRSSPPRRLRSPIKRRSRSPIDRSPKRDMKSRLTANSSKRDSGRQVTPENAVKSRSKPKGSEKEESLRKDDRDKRESDPVLEARRRKFEQQNTINKEGIIRLKTHDLKSEENSEEGQINDTEISTLEGIEENVDVEDDVLDVCTTESNIDGLFSDDDESEDENEGRFKSKGANVNAPKCGLNFSSLNNVADIQNKPLEDSVKRDRDYRGLVDRRRKIRRDRTRDRGGECDWSIRKPTISSITEKKDVDRKELRRDDDTLRRTRDDSKEERKSVKTRLAIRRGDKEEKNDKDDDKKVDDIHKKEREKEKVHRNGRNNRTERNDVMEMKRADVCDQKLKGSSGEVIAIMENREKRIKERSQIARKVIATEKEENNISTSKEEVTIIVDEEGRDVIKKNEAGDLRAQLSRKRAERQNKPTVTTEDVQSRLLHYALGAVFQKSTKSNKKQVKAAPREKLPIHKRLGPNEETSVKTKRLKRSTGEQDYPYSNPSPQRSLHSHLGDADSDCSCVGCT